MMAFLRKVVEFLIGQGDRVGAGASECLNSTVSAVRLNTRKLSAAHSQ
jgi:hypothetical protein